MKTRSTIFSLLVMLVLLTSLVFQTAPAQAAGAGITQDFRFSSAPGWVFDGTAALTGGVSDPDGDGWLRLTSAGMNQAGSAIYNTAFPNSEGIEVSFVYATYGGSGADGFTFYLIDGATAVPTVGAVGGSLGYSWRNVAPNQPGVTNGYVGIGFDEYGNFVNTSYGDGGIVSGATTSPDRIGIRGPGNLNAGFPYLTSAAMSIETGSRAGAKHVVIKITPSPNQTITVVVDGSTQISAFDISGHPMPATFKMGFSASTGGSTNFHEIRDVTVAGITPSTTAVVTSGSPSSVGASVTFTATVTDTATGLTTPTGNVAFYDGTTYLGTGTLAAGVATYATSALPAGSHTITAKYLGDSTYAISQGTVAQEVVANAPPVADDDSYSTPVNTLLNGSTVLNGDTDADGDPLTAIKVTDPTSGTLTAFNADGTFTYTPAAGFVGQATFTYKANDGSADSNTATVTIDVINTPPTITEGTETTVTMSEDNAPVPFALTLHATDPDGDPLTWSLQTPATYGSANINAASGVVSYSPYAHYYGNDSFVITVTDGRAIVPITVNVVVTPVDDPQLGANSFWLIYNNWRNNESAGYFDGNFITSKAGRLILAIPVNKSSLTLVVSKGPDQGMMQVQVDGVTVKNVDLYSATLVKNNNLVISLPVGSRKVTIIATGAKNPASTGTWVRLDSYRFNTDPIINADLNLALWSNFFRAGSRNYRATTQPGNVVLEFKGQVIGWYTYRGPDAGMVDVYVDGVYVQTIDLYNATALWDQVYTFGPYTYGLHTIEFRVLSTKNPLSTGRRVIMDQVDKE